MRSGPLFSHLVAFDEWSALIGRTVPFAAAILGDRSDHTGNRVDKFGRTEMTDLRTAEAL